MLTLLPTLLVLGLGACAGSTGVSRTSGANASTSDTVVSKAANGTYAPGITVPVGPVQHPAGETPAWWYRSGAARAAGNGAMQGKAKNVILFLGDGMSLPTVAAARILAGQRAGQPGEETQLAWERFPATALSRTYNTNAQTPDSAGTMSAITTGVKTHMGAISVSAQADKNDCASALAGARLTWVELAESAGMATGVVTTTRLTHATPAATYAHVPNREWENDSDVPASAAACKDIARQLAETPFGNGPTVAMGGGRTEFLPKSAGGQRRDGRDIVGEWRTRHPGGAYVTDTAGLQAAADAPTVLGLFGSSHMSFEHERDHGPQGQPSLAEMTRAAIRTLSRNPNGFVLMVEGGRIDHAHHFGNAFRALDETISMSDAVQAALDATSADDTLVIVTADHSHTLNFVGYPERGNPILGVVHSPPGADEEHGAIATDLAGRPFTTLVYANGPGNTGASDTQPEGPKRYPHEAKRQGNAMGRPDLAHVDTTDPDYLQETLVPLKSESHGGDDVGVWASGPGSAAVRGSIEQNVIYHLLVQATPRLRERLCKAGTCDAQGVPVALPDPKAFEGR